jgi:hypothetical protein
MAQAFLDNFTIETLGAAITEKQANIGHVVMEVLGYFKFGTVDVDLFVTEVLGATPNSSMTNIGHFNGEAIGQWLGF